jgi:hypothetical protein
LSIVSWLKVLGAYVAGALCAVATGLLFHRQQWGAPLQSFILVPATMVAFGVAVHLAGEDRLLPRRLLFTVTAALALLGALVVFLVEQWVGWRWGAGFALESLGMAVALPPLTQWVVARRARKAARATESRA